MSLEGQPLFDDFRLNVSAPVLPNPHTHTHTHFTLVPLPIIIIIIIILTRLRYLLAVI